MDILRTANNYIVANNPFRDMIVHLNRCLNNLHISVHLSRRTYVIVNKLTDSPSGLSTTLRHSLVE